MPTDDSARWQPTKIRRVEKCHDTGSEVVALVSDAGRAFAKFLGNREGPHVLACEFIGTRLAAALGLPVFDHALLPYDGCPEIHLSSGRMASTGPAWITRREEGFPWGGDPEPFDHVENRSDVAKLVLLDQWTLNCDRYRPEPLRVNYGNVFLSREATEEGKLRLIAMDHTHIFTCGRPLTPAIANIDRVQDALLYGVFPGFKPLLNWRDGVQAVEVLKSIDDAKIRAIIAAVPREWEVETPVRDAIVRFLIQRRDWLAKAFLPGNFEQSELFP